MSSKTPKLSLWDRPPSAAQGDSDKKEIWAAVGRALTSWGEYENQLGRLFNVLLTADFPSPQARRAFGAIRTFDGRLELLRGASEGFFHYRKGTPDEQKKFKDIFKDGKSAVERRNDIAHGMVMPFDWPPSSDNGFCLYPSYYDRQKRDLNDLPAFCWNSKSINEIADNFDLLAPQAEALGNIIISRIRERRQGVPPRWPW